jgi:hypothetical protein
MGNLGIAQSFVDTQQAPSPKEQDQQRKVERPFQMQQTPDFCCPCGGFLGWKQIRLGGKSLSRSYSDLRGLGNLQAKGWAWEAQEPEKMELLPPKVPEAEVLQQTPPGTSALERLPPEVLGKQSHLPFLLHVLTPGRPDHL